jgi:hypothetical protein
MFTVFSATIAAHKQSLALGTNTMFNLLYEMQQYVSSIVFNEPRPPNVWWSEDLKAVTVAGETLDFDIFRNGIQQMIEEFWKLYDEATGGRRVVDDQVMHFNDDLCDDTRGYSFLTHRLSTKFRNDLLRGLIEERKLAAVDADGRLSWNIPALHKFFLLCDKINIFLSILTYILPTINSRLTQFLDNKIRNDLRPRNLFMLQNEMLLITRYHKMTNQTGLDTCIPVFYPEALQDMTLEVFAGGLRNCQEVLSHALYGADAAYNYHTYVTSSFILIGAIASPLLSAHQLYVGAKWETNDIKPIHH